MRVRIQGRRFLLLVFFISPILSSAVGGDDILINFGGDGFTDSSNRQWQPSSPRFSLFASGSSSQDAQTFNSTYSADAELYTTAVFASYPNTLNITLAVTKPGPHWLRLHFAAFPVVGYPSPESSFFNATANGVGLLGNFSVVADAALFNGDSGRYSAVMKEFLLPDLPTMALSLQIIPSPRSYAFINGLELISAPSDLYNSSTYSILTGTDFYFSNHISFATCFRLHCGSGGVIFPQDDSLTRTWLEDPPYLGGVGGLQTTYSYPSTVLNVHEAPYYAPVILGQNNRELGSANRVHFNLTYLFPVASSASYLIRLLFCENEYSSPGDRVMDIFINSLAALSDFDVLLDAGYHTVTGKDFFVPVPDGQEFLRVDVGFNPRSVYLNPGISGIEVLRVGVDSLTGNTSSLSLDFITSSSSAPSPLYSPSPSPSSATSPFPPASANGPAAPPPPSSSSSSTAVIIGSIVGALAFCLFLFVLLFFSCSHYRGRRPSSVAPPEDLWIHNTDATTSPATSKTNPFNTDSSRGSESAGRASVTNRIASFLATLSMNSDGSSAAASVAAAGWREFSFAELREATLGFTSSRVIGEGGFGKVYKGTLPDGTKIAVKRAHIDSSQGSAEFEAEIRTLSQLRHRHLVALLGFCAESQEMILVYDFMGRGTLREHLYGSDRPPLSWSQRLQICIGAARGLHYLHTGAHLPVIHRDVKSTNILLDDKFVAKMADFGLSKLTPVDQTHVSTAVKGSFGYLDPEYFKRQQLTEKSDVFSFGVVLLEALCARAAILPSLPRDEANLVDWALDRIRSGLVDSIIDPRMPSSPPVNRASLDVFLTVAEQCLRDYGEDRPSMATVLFELERALKLQDSSVVDVDKLDEESDTLVLPR